MRKVAPALLVIMDPDWLYRFEVPAATAFQQIRQRLLALPIVQAADWYGTQLAQQEAMVGDLDFVLQQLAVALEEDYNENLSEAAKKSQQGFPSPPFYFDYVLMLDTHTQSGMGIYTRYYTPGEPGSIYYGRTVLRQGENQYRLWLE